MRLGTLFPLCSDIPIESLVLTILNLAFVFVEAVGAFLVGAVVAADFGWYFDLFDLLFFLLCSPSTAHTMHTLLR